MAMSKVRYPLFKKAQAIEIIIAGGSIVDAALIIGSSISTISRWYLDYRGYQGKEGVLVSFYSKMNR